MNIISKNIPIQWLLLMNRIQRQSGFPDIKLCECILNIDIKIKYLT